METTIPLEDLQPLMRRFIDEVGEDWVAKHGQGASMQEPILAQWIRQTQSIAREEWPGSQVALRLMRVALDLQTLRNSRVPGVEERAAQIKSMDVGKFSSTVQELATAAAYVRGNNMVKFIPEGEGRQADLLVNDEVEVECKLKVRETSRDRQRYDLYELLHRRIQQCLANPQAASRISVEVTFRGEPTREGVDKIADLVARAIRPEGPFAFTDTDGDPSYRLRATRGKSENLLAHILPVARTDEYDVTDLVTRTRVDELGRVEMEPVSLLAIKCEVSQDRVKSLEKSLKSAVGQFSKTRPAIIHVDITHSLPDLVRGVLCRPHSTPRSV